MTSAITRQHNRLYEIAKNSSLILAACLPFVVPFDSFRNIDQQGYLLIASGALAWFAIALQYKYFLSKLDNKILILLGIFVLLIIFNQVFNPNIGNNLFGAPLVRLGSLGIISCIGIGILSLDIAPKQLINWLYGIITLIAITALPYYIFVFDSIERIGGVFAQPDVLAAILGCGLLLGFEVIKSNPKRLKLLIISQLYIFAILLVTQTRVALFLTLIIALIYSWQTQKVLYKKQPVAFLIISVLMLVGLITLLPSRVTNTEYAKTSLDYRLSLQQSALNQSFIRPVTGYGIGNLADALDCRALSDQSLQDSCTEGYYFNSSHNIYLDRILGFGWIAGITYVCFVVFALWRGFHQTTEARIFAYCALLIALYYLTNVTSQALELLFWVLLLSCLKPNKTSRA